MEFNYKGGGILSFHGTATIILNNSGTIAVPSFSFFNFIEVENEEQYYYHLEDDGN
jgi:hypothetical protein